VYAELPPLHPQIAFRVSGKGGKVGGHAGKAWPQVSYDPRPPFRRQGTHCHPLRLALLFRVDNQDNWQFTLSITQIGWAFQPGGLASTTGGTSSANLIVIVRPAEEDRQTVSATKHPAGICRVSVHVLFIE